MPEGPKLPKQTEGLDRAWLMIDDNEAARRRFLESGELLVHRTNTAGAKGILKSRSLYLKNARRMEDTAEIELGRETVNGFIQTQGVRLTKALRDIGAELPGDLEALWHAELYAQLRESYIACFTTANLSDDLCNEDQWKEDRKVALFLDPEFLRTEPSHLSLYLVRVQYGADIVLQKLNAMLAVLEENTQLFRTVDAGILHSFLRHRLFFDSVSTKQVQYCWEREWRIVYSPHLFSSAQLSPDPVRDSNLADGVIPLHFNSSTSSGFPHLEIKHLFRKVLIHHEAPEADQVRHDLITLLSYNGLQNAREIVTLRARPSS